MAVFVRFDLENNDLEDDELTCVFCGLRKCDKLFVTKGGGRTTFYGIHDRCAEDHEERQREGKKTAVK